MAKFNNAQLRTTFCTNLIDGSKYNSCFWVTSSLLLITLTTKTSIVLGTTLKLNFPHISMKLSIWGIILKL